MAKGYSTWQRACYEILKRSPWHKDGSYGWPDELKPGDVWWLQYPGQIPGPLTDGQSDFLALMYQDLKIPNEPVPFDPDNPPSEDELFKDRVHAGQVRAWMEEKGIHPSEFIQAWFEACPQADPPAAWRYDQGITRREKQRRAILDVIRKKQFDPMAIPDGEKGTIEAVSRAQYPELFDKESSFREAWKSGVPKQWRMNSHDRYARRGE